MTATEFARYLCLLRGLIVLSHTSPYLLSALALDIRDLADGHIPTRASIVILFCLFYSFLWAKMDHSRLPLYPKRLVYLRAWTLFRIASPSCIAYHVYMSTRTVPLGLLYLAWTFDSSWTRPCRRYSVMEKRHAPADLDQSD